jgi:hypothetical protein
MASDQQGITRPSIGLDAEDWLTARPDELFRVRVSASSTGGICSVTEIIAVQNSGMLADFAGLRDDLCQDLGRADSRAL